MAGFTTILGPDGQPIDIPTEYLLSPLAAQVPDLGAIPSDLGAPPTAPAQSPQAMADAAALSLGFAPSPVPPPVAPATAGAPGFAEQDVFGAEPQPAPRPAPPAPAEPTTETAAEPPAPATPFEQRIQAQQTLGDISAQQADIQARGQADAIAEMRRRSAEDEQFRIAANKRFDDDLANLQKQQQELANTKIDPRRVFKEASTFSLIANLFSAFIGGALSATTGKNQALESIEREIDRDLDAQKAELAAKRDRYGQQLNLLQIQRARFGDEELARAATRSAAFQSAIQMVGAQSAGLESKAAQARSKELIAGLYEKQQAGIENAAAQAAEQQYRRMLADREYKLDKSRVGVQWSNLKETKRQFDERLKAEGAQATAAARSNEIPLLSTDGTPISAMKEKDRDAITESLGNYLGLDNNVQQLIDLRKQTGWKALTSSSPEGRRLQALKATVMGLVNRQFRFGALDKGATALIEQMTGDDPGSIRDPIAQWEQIKSSSRAMLIGEIQARTGQNVDPSSFQRFANTTTTGFSPTGERTSGMAPRGLPAWEQQTSEPLAPLPDTVPIQMNDGTTVDVPSSLLVPPMWKEFQ